MHTFTTRTTLIASALFLAACGGGGGGDGLSSARDGRIAIGITDAPIDDVLEVNVQFTGVTLKPASGDPIEIEFDQPRDIDLLSLTNGTTAELLPETVVPAGEYNWIRLAVNAQFDNVFDSYAVLPIGQAELQVPGGSQTGLQLVSGFTVLAGSQTNLVIDWDLRQALVDPVGQPGLFLRPALRITDMAEYGDLEGIVAPALIQDVSCSNDLAADTGNAVYLYTGAGVTPGDIADASEPPFTTAMVEQDIASGEYVYRISFLPPGDYTAAFTCQASDDLADTDDDIEFAATQDVTIETDATTVADF